MGGGRVDIRWGDISQIKAEMLLFKTALSNGHYSYFHLLSGADLPIKPLDYIFSFFEEHKNKEFVGFVSERDWVEKVSKFHLLTKYYKIDGKRKRVIDFIRDNCEKVINIFFQKAG